MIIIIFFGIIVFIIVGIAQYKAKNAPFEAIDENNLRASDNKEELIAYLEQAIRDNKKHLKERKYYDKEEKDNAKKALKERVELLDWGIQAFEDQYTQLTERFKFDVQSLLEISIDHTDWFYYYKSFYDPMNNEIWNEDSWQNMKEYLLKIKEIEKRMKEKTK